MCSFSIAVEVRKGGLAFTNSCTNSDTLGLLDTSLYRVGSIPRLLEPTVREAISLPLEKYHLDLKDILSVGVIQHPNSYIKYLVPLSDLLSVGNPEDSLQNPDFNCCLLDNQTVITFNELWAERGNNGQMF